MSMTPVFKTMDGVDIYDEQGMLWDVSVPQDWIGQTPAEYFLKWKADPRMQHRKGFHSEAKAREYLEKNRINYSLQDVVKAVNFWSMSPITDIDIFRFFKNGK